jgi:thiol-disulfide isomerase/thioredoxin
VTAFGPSSSTRRSRASAVHDGASPSAGSDPPTPGRSGAQSGFSARGWRRDRRLATASEARPTGRGSEAPLSVGGLVRSIAHRLAGDPLVLPDEGPLASFAGATTWLNSEPLTPEGERGRVVLVDFWTYTCVNWLRTAPYIRAWDAKYRGQGLTIVGVHTPEFGFEHDLDNVTREVAGLGVSYPVAVDSDYGIWRAFSNHFWPAIYLGDAGGRLRHHHFGEGEYAQTEMVIQQLLLDAGATDLDTSLVEVEPNGLEVAADWRTLRSPETYLGYRQATGFASGDRATFDRPRAYVADPDLPLNAWDLTGIWKVAGHASIATEPGGRIAFQFHARDVNLVMGPAEPGSAVRYRVLLDGRPAEGSFGTHVGPDGSGVVDRQTTYQLIRQTGSIGERRFEIEFQDAGVEAYCFTFG